MISIERFYETLNRPTPSGNRMEYILLICMVLLDCTTEKNKRIYS